MLRVCPVLTSSSEVVGGRARRRQLSSKRPRQWPLISPRHDTAPWYLSSTPNANTYGSFEALSRDKLFVSGKRWSWWRRRFRVRPSRNSGSPWKSEEGSTRKARFPPRQYLDGNTFRNQAKDKGYDSLAWRATQGKAPTPTGNRSGQEYAAFRIAAPGKPHLPSSCIPVLVGSSVFRRGLVLLHCIVQLPCQNAKGNK